MIQIFDYNDYRAFLTAWADQQAQARGARARMAQAAQVSTSMMSLVISGQKNLSLEQAENLVGLLSLNDFEVDYFFLLVELGRAGIPALRDRLRRRIRSEQDRAKRISQRVTKDVELTPEARATYYSSWAYTGFRNWVACGRAKDVQTMSEELSIPQSELNRVLDFLIENGLCKRQGGHVEVGPAHTHVDSESPLVLQHHRNWRLKAFELMQKRDAEDLFYTCPMSLSEDLAKTLRAQLPGMIEEILKKVRPSPSEVVRCLNIDWFDYTNRSLTARRGKSR